MQESALRCRTVLQWGGSPRPREHSPLNQDGSKEGYVQREYLGPPRKMADIQMAIAEEVRRDGFNLGDVGTTLRKTMGNSGAGQEKAMISGLNDIPDIKRYFRPGTHSSSLGGPTYDIKVPSFDATLWRYMDFAKFVSLLEDRSLFFARADKLGDPFEGAWSDVNHKLLEQGKKAETSNDVSNWVEAWSLIARNARVQRRFTLVNCWHASDYESEAMWRLYSGVGYGVAVRTDFKSLVHSFTERVPDIIANVEYLSYEDQPMPWSINAPFLHKRLSFAHEQEVRAIIRCYNYRETDREDVCEVGIPFSVDPVDLVQEVVVSPYAESWMLELVRSVPRRYGLNNPVRPSSMVRNPIW